MLSPIDQGHWHIRLSSENGSKGQDNEAFFVEPQPSVSNDVVFTLNSDKSLQSELNGSEILSESKPVVSNADRQNDQVLDVHEQELDEHAISHSFFSWACGCAALSLMTISLILMGLAVFQSSDGLDFKSYLSKCHYIIQLSGYFCMLHAVLSFRLYRSFFAFSVVMKIHIISHVLCLSLIISGVIVRVCAKNQDVKNGTYEPNLYTIHSFMGIGAISAYLLQFSITIISENLPPSYKNIKKFLTSIHKESGIFILSAMTIVLSCGVQQLFSRSQCSPHMLSSPDTSPTVSYATLGIGCKLLNGAGMLVYLSTLLATLAIAKPIRHHTMIDHKGTQVDL
jgi:hypothetical protein